MLSSYSQYSPQTFLPAIPQFSGAGSPQIGQNPYGQAGGYGQSGFGLDSHGAYGQPYSFAGQTPYIAGQNSYQHGPFGQNPYAQPQHPLLAAVLSNPYLYSQFLQGPTAQQHPLLTAALTNPQVQAHLMQGGAFGQGPFAQLQHPLLAAALTNPQLQAQLIQGAYGQSPFGQSGSSQSPFGSPQQSGFGGFNPQAQGWGATRPQTIQ